jgi:hypothetical protein
MKKHMFPSALVLLVLGFAIDGRAQSTNMMVTVAIPMPATTMEQIETTNSMLIVKSTAPAGSIYFNGGTISILAKEDFLPMVARKEHGIQIDVEFQGGGGERTIIDFDELNPLLNAMDYLNTINWNSISLASFDASYTTKAGLRIATYSSKRSGQIQFSIRTARMTKSIALAPDQVAQLRALIDQARAKLDALRKSA